MSTGTSGRTTIEWAGSALVSTAMIAVVAKIAGSLVAPGARGNLSGRAVNVVETVSGAFAYVLTALLVALVCTASFELARTRPARAGSASNAGASRITRGAVVAISGLIVALASPAVVERLSTVPTLALAVTTSLTALGAGIVVLRTPSTRAVGGMLVFLAASSLLHVAAWQTSARSFDHGSLDLHRTARALATAAVVAQALSVLVAAAWIGTRSRWRGRLLTNAAILLAFAITWVAARTTPAPSAVEAMLRQSLAIAVGTPMPFAVGSVAAFLLPCSILIAATALVERRETPIAVALVLGLLSQGAFDVPLHALLALASVEWAMLAMRPGAGYLRAGE